MCVLETWTIYVLLNNNFHQHIFVGTSYKYYHSTYVGENYHYQSNNQFIEILDLLYVLYLFLPFNCCQIWGKQKIPLFFIHVSEMCPPSPKDRFPIPALSLKIKEYYLPHTILFHLRNKFCMIHTKNTHYLSRTIFNLKRMLLTIFLDLQ